MAARPGPRTAARGSACAPLGPRSSAFSQPATAAAAAAASTAAPPPARPCPASHLPWMGRAWQSSCDRAPRAGSDIVQWLIKNLTIEDPVEALHLGTLMAAHGYFFPISDHVLTLKDDGTFYRFQCLSVNKQARNDCGFFPLSAVYLCKRTMQNKARLELADYEAESLARLQRAFARKWEFIFMQAEAQAKVDKKRDKIERKILDSQERAFWDVHRPVPGCVNTTEVDIKKSSRMRNPHKTRKSVYGLQNDIRSHSPTHTPTPETKPPTEDELQQQIKYWQIQLDRHRLKMSKVADSLLSYTEQYVEYDPFLVPPDPSNPWLSDDTTFWELEASKEPSQQRVKRWGFGMDEALKDPVGREQFLKFLESEFSSENLRFWLAVEDLKKRPIREVPSRVQEIWQEFLAPGAPSAINLDSKSYDKTTQNVKEPGRYTFEDAQSQRSDFGSQYPDEKECNSSNNTNNIIRHEGTGRAVVGTLGNQEKTRICETWSQRNLSGPY
ncbi:hypothetical protein JEQ12_003644 [Ovis aries]|uniref:Regulator of G-protein signaling 7 n=1 Tax=Ovis aries TaxID=9940 RepID=A0A836A6L7_SHEEP|nr:hypothetical protein JEQ12_003644 [Ovis aries]